MPTQKRTLSVRLDARAERQIEKAASLTKQSRGAFLQRAGEERAKGILLNWAVARYCEGVASASELADETGLAVEEIMRTVGINGRQAALDTFLTSCRNVAASQENPEFLRLADHFLAHEGETPRQAYEEFVSAARPDWWPIPRDFIPTPRMSAEDQELCFSRTMAMNADYRHDGYTPVLHVGLNLEQYVAAFQADEMISSKAGIALGGMVPNLLRAPRALPYEKVVASLRRVRTAFPDKQIHVFGIGGTATLHIAALLQIDSVDSSGWRNRAARGLIQLPGTGDRVVAELGSWRGRRASASEWDRLQTCLCPACKHHGADGLRAHGLTGASHRATHNLWVLLEESRLLDMHLADGSYEIWHRHHLDNSIYLPLIDKLASGNGARGAN